MLNALTNVRFWSVAYLICIRPQWPRRWIAVIVIALPFDDTMEQLLGQAIFRRAGMSVSKLADGSQIGSGAGILSRELRGC
jgi:hypothetical protein